MLFTNPLVWLDSPFTMTYLNGEGLALYASGKCEGRASHQSSPPRLNTSLYYSQIHA